MIWEKMLGKILKSILKILIVKIIRVMCEGTMLRVMKYN